MVINPNTGAIRALLNKGGRAGAWDWADQGSIALGVGAVKGDTGLLGDLDGDGLDDYAWTNTAGGGNKTRFWLNKDGKPSAWEWDEFSQSADFPVRAGQAKGDAFVDLTDDGRADHVSVCSSNGAVDAWLNPASSKWEDQHEIASGLAPGRQVRFADFNGGHKSDSAPSTASCKFPWPLKPGSSVNPSR